MMQLRGVRRGRPDGLALLIGTTERQPNDQATYCDGCKKNRPGDPTTSTLMLSCLFDQLRTHHQRLERDWRLGRFVTVHETRWMI